MTPTTVPDWADGFCYLAKQSYLVFGQERIPPVEWRPVVSWKREADKLIVLPATTRARADFFHIPVEQCHKKLQENEVPRDSYLCYCYESLPYDALIKIGILPHPIRIQIAQWLRSRLNL